jgi:hypothetical protein
MTNSERGWLRIAIALVATAWIGHTSGTRAMLFLWSGMFLHMFIFSIVPNIPVSKDSN